MLNAVYRLVAPRRFEVEFTDIDLTAGNVIVRPTYLSICNADQRYYQGKRAEDVLRQKLPMALIHEGIGQVVYDPEGEFQAGEKVVMIPNTPMSEDEIIAENIEEIPNSAPAVLTALCRMLWIFAETGLFVSRRISIRLWQRLQKLYRSVYMPSAGLIELRTNAGNVSASGAMEIWVILLPYFLRQCSRIRSYVSLV